MSARAPSLWRRRLLAGGLAAALLAPGASAVAQSSAEAAGTQTAGTEAADTAAAPAGQHRIIIVSRERLLDEAEAADRLSDAEAAQTGELQARIGAVKARLDAEEQALAQLRGDIPDAEFEARADDFDRRVRQARRVAQERAAILQQAFRDARATIVAALPPIIERLRAETGADIVLDSAQVLAVDDAIDMTDRAIALFDQYGPSPPLPEIDISGPLLPPPAADAAAGSETAPTPETGTEAGEPPDATMPAQ